MIRVIALLAVLSVMPIACEKFMHVPVPKPGTTGQGDTPPVLEEKPLPPV